ncbi:MAG TPA: MerR family transcriptional regulator [Bryobacteraceae bacterium]|nr:MerR family transcriptional regulator [Bryobacteraceae bacterium]
MDPSEWIGIGEFARLGGVSVKALRLYAQLGLLRPAEVKLQSRYRLYARSQLSTLHRIRLLKSAGFALAEIHSQLSQRDEASLAQVRARLVRRAEEIQRQLSWIDAETRSSSQLLVKQVAGLPVWSRRQAIDSYDHADRLLRELRREVPIRSRLVSGAIWHDCGRPSGKIDCEVFWLTGHGGRTAAPAELAPATVASVLHEGDDSTILASYEAAHRWIRDHRYRVAGPNRELYLAASLTEIQFPIH